MTTETAAQGARCSRCRDEVWADPLPLAWIHRHRHGTSESIFRRLWSFDSSTPLP